MPKLIRRRCAICGKFILITLDTEHPNENGKYFYTGGHYFGKLFEGEHNEVEYWECYSCYKKED